jgi:hypothetical protein
MDEKAEGKREKQTQTIQEKASQSKMMHKHGKRLVNRQLQNRWRFLLQTPLLARATR